MLIPKSPTIHYQFGKIANLMRIHYKFKFLLTALAYNWQENDESKQLEQSLRCSCIVVTAGILSFYVSKDR